MHLRRLGGIGLQYEPGFGRRVQERGQPVDMRIDAIVDRLTAVGTAVVIVGNPGLIEIAARLDRDKTLVDHLFRPRPDIGSGNTNRHWGYPRYVRGAGPATDRLTTERRQPQRQPQTI